MKEVMKGQTSDNNISIVDSHHLTMSSSTAPSSATASLDMEPQTTQIPTPDPATPDAQTIPNACQVSGSETPCSLVEAVKTIRKQGFESMSDVDCIRAYRLLHRELKPKYLASVMSHLRENSINGVNMIIWCLLCLFGFSWNFISVLSGILMFVLYALGAHLVVAPMVFGSVSYVCVVLLCSATLGISHDIWCCLSVTIHLFSCSSTTTFHDWLYTFLWYALELVFQCLVVVFTFSHFSEPLFQASTTVYNRFMLYQDVSKVCEHVEKHHPDVWPLSEVPDAPEQHFEPYELRVQVPSLWFTREQEFTRVPDVPLDIINQQRDEMV